ncbi:hypothetical protein [Clostridium sp. 001]|uniref:hypothetical protein n=1 Tax=Clostridium sp. 001 TaxID=1970093 RepID=UPI001C2C3F67|nr:hypothetical protein [Clostridium sp. 001]
MKVGDILKEKDIDSYNKLKKVKKKRKNDKLSECDIKELMHHSSYKRHKGALKQVK